MALLTATFKITKGRGVLDVDAFIRSAIGRDVSLIRGLDAVSLNDSTTQITLSYLDRPESVVDITNPIQGLLAGTGDGPDQYYIQYTAPIQFSSVTGGSQVLFNDLELTETDRFFLEAESASHIVAVNISGLYSDTGADVHNMIVDDTVLDLKGNKQPHSHLGGFTVTPAASSYLGHEEVYPANQRRGVVKLRYTTIDTSVATDRLVKERVGPGKELIAFATAKKSEKTTELFMLVLERPEPRIVETYPPLGALYPKDTPVDTVHLTFAQDLDRDQVENEPILSLNEFFGTTTQVSTSYVSLLSDDRTVKFKILEFLDDNAIVNQYPSVIIQTGLKTDAGVLLSKPYLIPYANNVNLARADVTGGTISGSSATGVATAFGDLTDVDLGTLGSGELPEYDGTRWVNTGTVRDRLDGHDDDIDKNAFDIDNVSGDTDRNTDDIGDLSGHLGRVSGQTDDNTDDISDNSFHINNISGYLDDVSGQLVDVIDDLDDVIVGTPSSGDILEYDGTNWIATGNDGSDTGIPPLVDLSDVSIAGPVDGDVPTWDGSNWVNRASDTGQPPIDDLDNVDITDLSVDDILQYDGNNWIATGNDGGDTGIPPLVDLADVNVAGPLDGDSVQWDGGSSTWVNRPSDTGTPPIDDLINVDITDLGANDILQYDGNNWIATGNDGGDTGIPPLVDLTDVSIAGPSDGDFVAWDTAGDQFTNRPSDTGQPPVDDLINVDITDLSSGLVLEYDGTAWVATGIGGMDGADTGIPPLVDLSDVSIAGPADGDFVGWDTDGNGFVNRPSHTGFPPVGDLTDVTLGGSSLSSGDVMRWDGGSDWINDPDLGREVDKHGYDIGNISGYLDDVSGDVPTFINDLDDVLVLTPSEGQQLEYSSDLSRWVNRPGDTGEPPLVNLADVSLGSPSDGDAVTWDTAGDQWVGRPSDTGQPPIDDLINVDITDLSSGHILEYDGTAWVTTGLGDMDGSDTGIPPLVDLTDVSIAGPSDGDFVGWDTAGNNFTNRPSNTGQPPVADLNDVSLGGVELEDGNVLSWLGATWVNDSSLPTAVDTNTFDIANVSGNADGNTDSINDNTFHIGNISGYLDDVSGGVPDNLTDLDDVSISSPSDGDVLSYDAGSSEWVNSAGDTGNPNLGELADVYVAGISSGSILEYDGNNWIGTGNAGAGGGDTGIPPLVDLADVSIAGPADGDFVGWDTDGNQFTNRPSDTGQPNFGDLSDVSVAGLSSGDVPEWDGGTWRATGDFTNRLAGHDDRLDDAEGDIAWTDFQLGELSGHVTTVSGNVEGVGNKLGLVSGQVVTNTVDILVNEAAATAAIQQNEHDIRITSGNADYTQFELGNLSGHVSDISGQLGGGGGGNYHGELFSGVAVDILADSFVTYSGAVFYTPDAVSYDGGDDTPWAWKKRGYGLSGAHPFQLVSRGWNPDVIFNPAPVVLGGGILSIGAGVGSHQEFFEEQGGFPGTEALGIPTLVVDVHGPDDEESVGLTVQTGTGFYDGRLELVLSHGLTGGTGTSGDMMGVAQALQVYVDVRGGLDFNNEGAICVQTGTGISIVDGLVQINAEDAGVLRHSDYGIHSILFTDNSVPSVVEGKGLSNNAIIGRKGANLIDEIVFGDTEFLCKTGAGVGLDTMTAGDVNHLLNQHGSITHHDYDDKGDLQVGQANNEYFKLPIDDNDAMLMVDTNQGVGMKWAAGTMIRDAHREQFYTGYHYSSSGDFPPDPEDGFRWRQENEWWTFHSGATGWIGDTTYHMEAGGVHNPTSWLRMYNDTSMAYASTQGDVMVHDCIIYDMQGWTYGASTVDVVMTDDGSIINEAIISFSSNRKATNEECWKGGVKIAKESIVGFRARNGTVSTAYKMSARLKRFKDV